MILIYPIPSHVIADTVAAVLRSPDFAAQGSTSLWSLVIQWIAALIGRFLQTIVAHPAIGTVIRAATVVALVLVVARIVYVTTAQRAASHATHGSAAERGTDWAATARRLAANGQFTDAAHALYLALLTAAARRGFVTLHESKTAGDYLRELRRKRAPVDLGSFTEFTRSYETAIYGIGECDADRYTHLESLATTLLGAAR